MPFISVTIFFVLLLGSLSTALFILTLLSRGLLETVWRQIYSSLIFLSLNLFAMATAVVPSALSLGSADETEEKLEAKTLTRRLFKSPNSILFVALLATTLLPNIAPYVGEVPLRLLNIGGGVERLFYLSKKVADDLPAEILEVCDDKAGKCRLKLLQVLLDLGPIIYVRVASDENSAIYRIPRAGLIDVLAKPGKKPNKSMEPTH